ncbi:MAG: DUF4159 domain-containing protein [Gemmatimonadales bacterium]
MNLSAHRVTIAVTGLVVMSLAIMAIWSGGSSRRPSTVPRSSVVSPQEEGPPEPGREFYFTRAEYSGTRWGYGRGYGRGSWATDWPKADIQFLIGVKRLTNIDAYDYDNPVRLDDPKLRRYPFIYALEVGYMNLTEGEVVGLRSYLLAGGFLVIDDFWGTYQWANFEVQIKRVLPEFSIVDLPLDHPLLNAFYNIDEILQVPNVGNGRRGGPTWEQDGFVPKLRGIFDDRGRLMVVINWNTDLGDAWEWAEDPWYPLKYSNFAYSLGINMIVYGMSH